ncbi:AlbA family DNA-binding domain-containing protein [Kocuria soli]|uniref:AlbA family DNA-binding domain-containing protein n=1 Tax=Kocuria soli TaxID=2485125 RepID=UPI000F503E9A|nr:ATP-binding protein [Kocuria soli]
MTGVEGPAGGAPEISALVRQDVERLLWTIEHGRRLHAPESQHVDLKEEANRRLNNGRVLPGHSENEEAAVYLAPEVCCMANTPLGGALVLGVEDGTLLPIGTELDADWLAERVFVLCGVRVAVERRYLLGHRVLILWVPESPTPVLGPDGKLRWRVQDSCLAVDLQTWWRARWHADEDPVSDVEPRHGDGGESGGLGVGEPTSE